MFTQSNAAAQEISVHRVELTPQVNLDLITHKYV